MYYIVLKDKVIGPFERRAAFEYAANVLNLNVNQYQVFSDRVCQNRYLHLPIEKPKDSSEPTNEPRNYNQLQLVANSVVFKDMTVADWRKALEHFALNASNADVEKLAEKIF
jgi:hypothetical protein